MVARKILLGGIAGFALFAVVGWLGLEWAYGRFERAPTLVRGLEFEWGNEDSPLDWRLRELCEPGTPGATCGRILQEQGLELRGERHAQQAWGGYRCQYFVEVDWQADAEDRLNMIRGNYGATCT